MKWKPSPVLVEEGEVAVVDEGALDLFPSSASVPTPSPPSEMRRMLSWVTGVPLAGVDVLGGQHDVELALHVDDGALAERAGGYFQNGYSSMTTVALSGRAIPLMNFLSRPL